MKKVTVIIPCYNESLAIAEVINKFPVQRSRHAGFKLDILVVDNNSTDNTAEIAKKCGARVVFEAHPGKGYAVRTGFYNLADDCDYVVMLDGDNTYKPEEIFRLLEPLDSGFAQAIVGSRMLGRINDGSMKRFNRLGNQAYSGLVRNAYRVMVTDVLTGYMAWTKDAVLKLRPQLHSSGFSIEMEMVTKMARLGIQIYSVPISYDARIGESNLRPVRDGLHILRTYFGNLRWNPEQELPPIVTPRQLPSVQHFKKYSPSDKGSSIL